MSDYSHLLAAVAHKLMWVIHQMALPVHMLNVLRQDTERDARCDTDYLYPGSRADPTKRQATNADGAMDP